MGFTQSRCWRLRPALCVIEGTPYGPGPIPCDASAIRPGNGTGGVRAPRWSRWSFANRQNWAVRPCDHVMRCRPGKMRAANFRTRMRP